MDSELAAEIAELEQRVKIYERKLERDPSNTRIWVARSETYQSLAIIMPNSNFTSEQLFFGNYVANTTREYTRKAAACYSYLALKPSQELADSHFIIEEEQDE